MLVKRRAFYIRIVKYGNTFNKKKNHSNRSNTTETVYKALY